MLLKTKLFGRTVDVKKKKKNKEQKQNLLLGCLCTEFLHKKYGKRYN